MIVRHQSLSLKTNSFSAFSNSNQSPIKGSTFPYISSNKSSLYFIFTHIFEISSISFQFRSKKFVQFGSSFFFFSSSSSITRTSLTAPILGFAQWTADFRFFFNVQFLMITGLDQFLMISDFSCFFSKPTDPVQFLKP